MTENDFWNALAPVPAPPAPIYRLYYDDQGWPLFYSMESVPGNYIEIDYDTWHNPANVRILNGILVRIKTVVVHKLVPGDIGTTCHPQDVAVVVNALGSNTKWSVK